MQACELSIFIKKKNIFVKNIIPILIISVESKYVYIEENTARVYIRIMKTQKKEIAILFCIWQNETRELKIFYTFSQRRR